MALELSLGLDQSHDFGQRTWTGVISIFSRRALTLYSPGTDATKVSV